VSAHLSTNAETADEFRDASAIVPLLIMTEPTKTVQVLAKKDPTMLVWSATEVECASAIARLERDDVLDDVARAQGFERLNRLAGGWYDVAPSDSIREAAVRFCVCIRSARPDELRRAAAFIAAERRPSSLEVVTLGHRLEPSPRARKDS
jgi:hypothetical protein